ncbi:hypothetical protein D4764_11G0010480 [Takifugu flavidus]|uniref:Uncharacterized protein n=1 Tax=Takifugu flavidus TaxID=433684 RepID=A0A5C6PKM0_9TELE|nr:hypothetical protein D4764_11G0010480 [Takifugu flavidus]
MYNSCPDLLKLLLKLVTIACQTQTISSEWSKAITTFILKEKDTHDVSYFRVVALMNVEGKICKQIHRHHFPKAKSRKSDLHVVWQDLAKAYVLVPQQLISFSLNFFHIPPGIQSLITKYFDKFHVCNSTQTSPNNLHLWCSSDQTRLLCKSQNQSLKNFLALCNAALAQG